MTLAGRSWPLRGRVTCRRRLRSLAPGLLSCAGTTAGTCGSRGAVTGPLPTCPAGVMKRLTGLHLKELPLQKRLLAWEIASFPPAGIVEAMAHGTKPHTRKGRFILIKNSSWGDTK